MADAIAVTGASGFVGRALTAHLAQRGFAVRALSRAGAGPDLPGVTHLRYELTAPAPAALDGARAVIHAAFADRIPEHGPDPNAVGARILLDAARASGVKPIFLSSFSAHDDAISAYGRSKLAIERLFDQPGDAVLKLGLVVGDGGVFARMRSAAEGRTALPVPGAGKPVQVVAVGDVCLAAEHVVRDDLDGTFWIASPDAVPMRALYRTLAGPGAHLVPIPLTPLLAIARAARGIGIPLPFTVDNVAGLMRMRRHPTRTDLARVGLTARAFEDVVRPTQRKEADAREPR
ncbi:MAG TPA: NAD(P)-dependent oxidoreductase [Conexibacter sp.]|jgi:nucleoside-diphosphate-sugar epimerase|nr:NAD(P)-dependent oxidoreductase [Conexibacter sp.]